MVWELIGYNTDCRHSWDVRYRKYTSSKPCADAFAKIPKIQFSDSGHGIVFHAREHKGPRMPVILTVADHVNKEIKIERTRAGKNTKQGRVSDVALLDWASAHPAIVINAIGSYWAHCGPGYRGECFNFRAVIKGEMEKDKCKPNGPKNSVTDSASS